MYRGVMVGYMNDAGKDAFDHKHDRRGWRDYQALGLV